MTVSLALAFHSTRALPRFSSRSNNHAPTPYSLQKMGRRLFLIVGWFGVKLDICHQQPHRVGSFKASDSRWIVLVHARYSTRDEPRSSPLVQSKRPIHESCFCLKLARKLCNHLKFYPPLSAFYLDSCECLFLCRLRGATTVTVQQVPTTISELLHQL